MSAVSKSQLREGSRVSRGMACRSTPRMVPLGSKSTQRVVLQPGQGTWTRATDRPARDNPLPAHLTVTLKGSWHAQQEKSRITCSSVMENGPQCHRGLRISNCELPDD